MWVLFCSDCLLEFQLTNFNRRAELADYIHLSPENAFSAVNEVIARERPQLLRAVALDHFCILIDALNNGDREALQNLEENNWFTVVDGIMELAGDFSFANTVSAFSVAKGYSTRGRLQFCP